jgi:hypothetical protein
MFSRKLPGFREAVKPRPVGGDRSHGATFFYFSNFLRKSFSFAPPSSVLPVAGLVRVQQGDESVARAMEIGGRRQDE